MICEKRHHKGEHDISYPAIFCDLCAVRIDDPSQANYCWNHLDEGPGDYYNRKSVPIFLHKKCNVKINSMERANQGKHFLIKTEFGVLNTEDIGVQWMSLECFPFFLGRNLGMKMSAGRENVTVRARIERNGWF